MKYGFFSIKEVAEAIFKAPFNTSFDFTFDTKEDLRKSQPEGWHGAKRIVLFGEEYGVIAFGYYGGGSTLCKELESHDYINIIPDFIKWCKYYDGDKVDADYKLCVEVTEENQKYLPRRKTHEKKL